MFPRAIFVAVLLCRCAAAAVPFELLAEFTRPGAHPLAPLVQTAEGDFYGTAADGGAFDLGSVFKVNAAGEVTTLVSFSGVSGNFPGRGPDSPLTLAQDGWLYGVTPAGGAGNFGTIFKVSPAGEFAAVYTFTGGSSGSVPQGLVQHTDGNFFGVTMAGGSGGFGTVFRLTPAGVLTTLVEFTGTSGVHKGASPAGILTFSGNTLYGVTREGGASNLGTVYSLTTSGVWNLLVEFTGTAGARPGESPVGGLLLNTDGALYGLTEWGGANGFGTAYKLTTGGTFTALRSFADATGSQPAGRLVRGTDGQLYGITQAGGTSGLGTAFRLTTAGVETVLTHFTPATGAVPVGGFVRAASGELYGTASAGGAGNLGAVFKLSTAGLFTPVSSLSLPLGWTPGGAPVLEPEGTLLFPMTAGGTGGGGTLARLSASGAVAAVASFTSTVGTGPVGAPVAAGGVFYGVTSGGGASGRGTAYTFSNTAGLSLVSNFTTTSGSLAEGPLLPGSDGAFFGVGREGGAVSRGAIYKLSGAGVRTRIVSFTGTTGAVRGNRPRGPLLLAANARYYGVTESGGAADRGTLYSLTAAGGLTTLAEFTATGPRSPLGGLVSGSDGLLYGTLSAGGDSGDGVVFRVDPATNSWTVAASFAASTTGSSPGGPLLAGPGGAIYGIAAVGGTAGAGTVWRYTASGGLETLADFTGEEGPVPGRGRDADGSTGGLVFGSDGKLYGVAPAGGSGGGGCAFRLTLATPYQTWLQAELGDAGAPDHGDPDADGVPTLLEYALLQPPGIPSSASLPAGALMDDQGGQFLALSVPRDPARGDVSITVEAASSLSGPWTALAVSAGGQPFAGPGYSGGDAPTPGPKQVTIRDTVALHDTSRRFMRIRAAR